jgi:hypothetical protein
VLAIEENIATDLRCAAPKADANVTDYDKNLLVVYKHQRSIRLISDNRTGSP